MPKLTYCHCGEMCYSLIRPRYNIWGIIPNQDSSGKETKFAQSRCAQFSKLVACYPQRLSAVLQVKCAFTKYCASSDLCKQVSFLLLFFCLKCLYLTIHLNFPGCCITASHLSFIFATLTGVCGLFISHTVYAQSTTIPCVFAVQGASVTLAEVEQVKQLCSSDL